MSKIRTSHILVALSVFVATFTLSQSRLHGQAGAKVPTFKVDPSWPLEMPNHWIMGAVTGVFVDAKQHVWVTHLPEVLTEEELYEEPWNVVPPPAQGAGRGAAAAAPAAPKERPVQMGTCCKAAPPVLEFDQTGQAGAGLGTGLLRRHDRLAARAARHLRRS